MPRIKKRKGSGSRVRRPKKRNSKFWSQSSKSKKQKVKKKKQLFYDTVSESNVNLGNAEKIQFIKSSFRVSFVSHFWQKFNESDLWKVMIGSFCSALFIGFNWHLIAIISFVSLMTSYSQWKSRQKTKAIEYCSLMLSKDPEKLNEFLETISAPKNTNSNKSGDFGCEWLNDILAKFWPHINSIAQNQIDKKGFDKRGLDVGNGHKIFFERFTLGDKPPALTSVQVRQNRHRKDEIVIILKLIYFGNCLILFSYKTKVFLKAKAGVKDVYFRGEAVIVLRPLLEVPPFIGGISVCLESEPLIDYNGINLANIADNKLFKSFLINILNSYLVSPNKIFVPLIDNSNIRRELKYPLPIGLCFVEIIEAEDLPAMDSNRCLVLKGSSDSFCKLKVGDNQFSTVTVYNSLNPYFGESFSAPIHDFDDNLKIELLDKDAISSDDFMGSLEFKLSDIGVNKHLNGRDKWLPIGKCPTGGLHFRIAVFELSSNKKNVNKILSALRQSSIKFPVGILSVYIYYVSHISTSDEESDFKPVVRLKFSEQTFQTKSSKPPKKGFYYFEESVNFLCNDLEKDVLEVSVICQEMKTLNFSKVFGETNIALKDMIDSKPLKDMTLNQEFPIRKILKLKDVTEVKNSGFIRMFLCFKVCKFKKRLIENLKIAANIQSNIEQTTKDQNSITKLYREPVSSLRNPFRSIRIIANRLTPNKPKTIVAEDLIPMPPHVRHGCWLKIRIKWPDRTTLHVEVLKVIRIPFELIESSFKYGICVRLSLKKNETKAVNKSLRIDGNKGLKDQMPIKAKLNRLETRYTQKHPIVNYSTDIEYNERLIFKISPNSNIDSHVLEYFLLTCHPRRYFAVVYDIQFAAYTPPIDIPKVDFKGDSIEQWFRLNVYQKFRKNNQN